MARWHSCNVLQPGAEVRHLWQFSAGGDKFTLQRQEAKLQHEPLPVNLIEKDWQTLLQPRLNIAWLPADKVFLRVVQLPKSDLAETQSMVELQLEKLSPLPVAQIVWGFELMPHAPLEMQTAIVIIVARSYVEEFLGTLEGQGYLADRLELPFVDQIRATQVKGDGVWIYPGVGADNYSCLVAWWYGGTLQNLSLLHLPPGEKRAALLQEQLAQMNWAGELEGWMTSTPRYHLVADTETAESWKGSFPPEQPVELVRSLSPPELAALTARRVAGNSLRTNLLPPEYSARYRQQFIDRLWMRGLGALLVIYVMAAALYLGWAQFAKWRCSRVDNELGKIGPNYTNTLQLKEQVKILQDQVDLQYAALDCWKAVADNMPPELTLESLSFDRGRRLTLTGSAANDGVGKVQEFNEFIAKSKTKDRDLFKHVDAPSMGNRPGVQDQITWRFVSDLKLAETE